MGAIDQKFDRGRKSFVRGKLNREKIVRGSSGQEQPHGTLQGEGGLSTKSGPRPYRNQSRRQGPGYRVLIAKIMFKDDPGKCQERTRIIPASMKGENQGEEMRGLTDITIGSRC